MMVSLSDAPLERGSVFESTYIHEFRIARDAGTLSAPAKNNSFQRLPRPRHEEACLVGVTIGPAMTRPHMTSIPKDVTIPFDDLHRSALQSLMNGAPPNYELADLLQLVLTKGLQAMLVGRELPEVTRQSAERSEEPLPQDAYRPRVPRGATDYIGFPLDREQASELDNLLITYSHLSEEEVCRILLDCGLRDVHRDPFVQELLAKTRTGTAPAEGGA